MNLIFFYVPIFLSVLHCKFVSSLTDEEYLEKSILRSIRDKKGQFNSKFNHLQINRDTVTFKIIANISHAFEEKFDYRADVGEFFRGPNERFLYINRNETKEVYKINYRNEFCHSSGYFWMSVYSWLNDRSFDLFKLRGYSLAGPNVLMEILLKHYENRTENKEIFECVDFEHEKESKKCTVLINENVKFEYYLKDKDDYTMVPSRIHTMQKNKNTDEWLLMNVYKYLEFTPVFDEKSIFSTSLPLYFGCSRHREFAKYYPSLEASYGGDEFLIKQDVTFNYLTPNDSDSSPCKFCNFNRSKLHLISRSYTNEMYVNQNESINIVKTIDEFTNAPIKTIYNYDTNDTHTVHRVNLDDDKCLTYSLPTNHSTNYFYIQDLFINRKELFYSKFKRSFDYYYQRRNLIFTSGFSYLGDYKVNDLDYLVFESTMYLDGIRCSNCYRNKNGSFERNEVFKNKNLIQPDKITATFYYLRSVYSPENKQQIPAKIEFRFYSYFERIGTLTIDITSLELATYEKYDTSKCEKE